MAAVLLLTGVSGAAVLESFGTVTGSADVKPALEIVEVYDSNDTVAIINNREEVFDSGSYNVVLTYSGGSETFSSDIDPQSALSVTVDDDLEAGGNEGIMLEINGNVVSETEDNYEVVSDAS